MLILKNRELINKLLIALMVENGDSLSLKNCEMMLDNLVNAHDVYPTFKDQQVTWNVEDHTKQEIDSFLKTLKNMSTANDLINICFSPRCNGCDNHLRKLSANEMQFKFMCPTCNVEYKFEVVHTGEPIGMNIDDLDGNEN